jgi:predicted nucleic acid-binding Zn ribbon protein
MNIRKKHCPMCGKPLEQSESPFALNRSKFCSKKCELAWKRRGRK